MIQYVEYVKGQKRFSDMIINAEMHELSSDCYYPIIPMQTEEDYFPLEEVQSLRKEEVLVCEYPGREPIKKVLRIDESDLWAYELQGLDI